MITTKQIWIEYHNKLSAFIRTRVAADVADDILQNVFIKIHTRIDSLKDDTKLESWLYQITRNAIIDYYRSIKPTEDLPDWIEQPQPEDEIDRKTQKQVSEMKNISLSCAKSRVQRGRALLKAMLYQCCQIEINQSSQLVSYDKKDRNCKFC